MSASLGPFVAVRCPSCGVAALLEHGEVLALVGSLGMTGVAEQLLAAVIAQREIAGAANARLAAVELAEGHPPSC